MVASGNYNLFCLYGKNAQGQVNLFPPHDVDMVMLIYPGRAASSMPLQEWQWGKSSVLRFIITG
jgi:hypothetical protein